MKKKLQVFISSTFLDLKEERQAAVEAILDAGHIPAGMELFKAGNEDQLNTIYKWIDDSDVYMLILGGRYGSLEPRSRKSYTHLEYDYAINNGTPVFAVILSDSWLLKKAAATSMESVFEQNFRNQYSEFKANAQSKMIRPADDEKDIKLTVHTSLSDFLNRYDFSGWVKGSEVNDNSAVIDENRKLLKENSRLKETIQKLNTGKLIGDFSYEDLKRVLKKKKFTIPKGTLGAKEEVSLPYLAGLVQFRSAFTTGIENRFDANEEIMFLYTEIAPTLINVGLLEKLKVTGVRYERIQLSKAGNKFLTYWDLEEHS